LFDLFEEFKKLRFAIEVSSIAGGVLGDEDDFFGSLVNEGLDFVKELRNWKRSLFSSDFGDNAKGAGIVASFGDFEVFKFMGKVGEGSGGIGEENSVEFISRVNVYLGLDLVSCWLVCKFFPVFDGTSSYTNLFPLFEKFFCSSYSLITSRRDEATGIE
jgi:hypothetical protein